MLKLKESLLHKNFIKQIFDLFNFWYVCLICWALYLNGTEEVCVCDLGDKKKKAVGMVPIGDLWGEEEEEEE